MKSTSSYVCLSTVCSHEPNVGICALELPQTTSSTEGSSCRIAFAVRRRLAVVLGAAVAQLPGSIHFVPKAPHRDGVGLAATVCDARVRQGRPRANVGVLQHVQGLLNTAGP